MTITAYCTKADIASVLSEQGIDYAVDDERLGDFDAADLATRVSDCINRASARVNQYCTLRYDLTSFPGNTWIKWCTATIAAVMLMRRRGDSAPDGLIAEYNEYIDFLKDVKNGTSVIPPDVAGNDAKLLVQNAGITMTNLHLDLRFRVIQVRAITRVSTGPFESKLIRQYDFRSSYFLE